MSGRNRTGGPKSILDYPRPLAPTVLEYLEASGDRATAEDLWPLVLKQLDFTLEPVNAEGLLLLPKGWWLFIDWDRTLDKQAAEQAVVLYGLRATRKLAEKSARPTRRRSFPRSFRGWKPPRGKNLLGPIAGPVRERPDAAGLVGFAGLDGPGGRALAGSRQDGPCPA